MNFEPCSVFDQGGSIVTPRGLGLQTPCGTKKVNYMRHWQEGRRKRRRKTYDAAACRILSGRDLVKCGEGVSSGLVYGMQALM